MKEVIGWIGVTTILGAYALNMFGVIESSHTLYGFMNLVGAMCIIVSSYAKKDFQPVVLNAIWLMIALIGIIRSLM